MKRDGTLTQSERTTMIKAFDIMQKWVKAHRMDDDEDHVDGIFEAVRLLNAHMHAMLRETMR